MMQSWSWPSSDDPPTLQIADLCVCPLPVPTVAAGPSHSAAQCLSHWERRGGSAAAQRTQAARQVFLNPLSGGPAGYGAHAPCPPDVRRGRALGLANGRGAEVTGVPSP